MSRATVTRTSARKIRPPGEGDVLEAYRAASAIRQAQRVGRRADRQRHAPGGYAGELGYKVMTDDTRADATLLQRIGRANHRMDEPSRGVLVPANRFEVLECRAAIDAVAANAQDTPPLRTG